MPKIQITTPPLESSKPASKPPSPKGLEKLASRAAQKPKDRVLKRTCLYHAVEKQKQERPLLSAQQKNIFLNEFLSPFWKKTDTHSLETLWEHFHTGIPSTIRDYLPKKLTKENLRKVFDTLTQLMEQEKELQDACRPLMARITPLANLIQPSKLTAKDCEKMMQWQGIKGLESLPTVNVLLSKSAEKSQKQLNIESIFSTIVLEHFTSTATRPLKEKLEKAHAILDDVQGKNRLYEKLSVLFYHFSVDKEHGYKEYAQSVHKQLESSLLEGVWHLDHTNMSQETQECYNTFCATKAQDTHKLSLLAQAEAMTTWMNALIQDPQLTKKTGVLHTKLNSLLYPTKGRHQFLHGLVSQVEVCKENCGDLRSINGYRGDEPFDVFIKKFLQLLTLAKEHPQSNTSFKKRITESCDYLDTHYFDYLTNQPESECKRLQIPLQIRTRQLLPPMQRTLRKFFEHILPQFAIAERREDPELYKAMQGEKCPFAAQMGRYMDTYDSQTGMRILCHRHLFVLFAHKLLTKYECLDVLRKISTSHTTIDDEYSAIQQELNAALKKYAQSGDPIYFHKFCTEDQLEELACALDDQQIKLFNIGFELTPFEKLTYAQEAHTQTLQAFRESLNTALQDTYTKLIETWDVPHPPLIESGTAEECKEHADRYHRYLKEHIDQFSNTIEKDPENTNIHFFKKSIKNTSEKELKKYINNYRSIIRYKTIQEACDSALPWIEKYEEQLRSALEDRVEKNAQQQPKNFKEIETQTTKENALHEGITESKKLLALLDTTENYPEEILAWIEEVEMQQMHGEMLAEIRKENKSIEHAFASMRLKLIEMHKEKTSGGKEYAKLPDIEQMKEQMRTPLRLLQRVETNTRNYLEEKIPSKAWQIFLKQRQELLAKLKGKTKSASYIEYKTLVQQLQELDLSIPSHAENMLQKRLRELAEQTDFFTYDAAKINGLSEDIQIDIKESLEKIAKISHAAAAIDQTIKNSSIWQESQEILQQYKSLFKNEHKDIHEIE